MTIFSKVGEKKHIKKPSNFPKTYRKTEKHGLKWKLYRLHEDLKYNMSMPPNQKEDLQQRF